MRQCIADAPQSIQNSKIQDTLTPLVSFQVLKKSQSKPSSMRRICSRFGVRILIRCVGVLNFGRRILSRHSRIRCTSMDPRHRRSNRLRSNIAYINSAPESFPYTLLLEITLNALVCEEFPDEQEDQYAEYNCCSTNTNSHPDLSLLLQGGLFSWRIDGVLQGVCNVHDG